MTEQLYCPSCGKQSVVDNKCTACDWVGCEYDDHDFKYESDRDVGIEPHLHCKSCDLEIEYDGRFDNEDFE